VIKQFQHTVGLLYSAPNTESLYKIKSLHYMKKEGDLKGIEAVYVNKQYRLEFISRLKGKEPNKITICSLIELSSHYKK
jgi:proteic killer suppression protein